ncbi:DgyrCDS14566 [Dimorphilus gyrociliatus]|uniref:DgyrCDS14566 n=1 Tax=Dimorphilus gyrociliatus TaxID=2664684 RepID=A0A7I8WE66_9ANNE|nr:DgyrCDS14566 [Dimorphilus gyrociliatus]
MDDSKPNIQGKKDEKAVFGQEYGIYKISSKGGMPCNQSPYPYPQPVLAQPLSTTMNNQIYGQQPNHLITHKPPVRDTMILSICSMLFCICIGLASLVKSIQSRKARDRGRVDEANKKALCARKFAFAAIITGLCFAFVSIVTRIILTIMAVQ